MRGGTRLLARLLFVRKVPVSNLGPAPLESSWLTSCNEEKHSVSFYNFNIWTTKYDNHCLRRRTASGVPGGGPRQRLHEADRTVQEAAGGAGQHRRRHRPRLPHQEQDHSALKKNSDQSQASIAWPIRNLRFARWPILMAMWQEIFPSGPFFDKVHS